MKFGDWLLGRSRDDNGVAGDEKNVSEHVDIRIHDHSFKYERLSFCVQESSEIAARCALRVLPRQNYVFKARFVYL
jgi:hypothetical protein